MQTNTIFLSMIMEAVPFVLVGVLVSGFIQMFLTEKWIARVMPKNRILATLFGCGAGVFFPSCECGIVPITRRLLRKGVPLNAGIAFMLSGPVINPIVLFSTFIAFGNDWRVAAIRAGMAVCVAFLTALTLSLIFPRLPMKVSEPEMQVAATSEAAMDTGSPPVRPAFGQRIAGVLTHSVDEFFSVGKYLVLGAFIAACMQTYVPTASLLRLGSDPLTSSLVMIGLAFTLSLCSEADAFIAASFRSTFSVGALSAFLVFGPMVDIKNTLMMLGTFRGKFVAALIALVTVYTLIGSLIVGRLFG